MPLSDLAWTTRAEVAAELLDHLQGTHPLAPDVGCKPEDPPRARVAALLALVATPVYRNPLLAIALDPEEEVDVRRNAVWGLERISAAISGDDLQALFYDRDLCTDPQRLFGAADILSLARSPSAEEVAQLYLQRLTPAQRAALLIGSSTADADASQRIVEWLYRQWLDHDRHALHDELSREGSNRRVIRRTLPRAESRRVLQEYWRQASGEDRTDLLNDLQDEEYEWTFPEPLTPAEQEELAQALALPAAALAARFGRRGLIGLLEKTLTAEHHYLASTLDPKRSVRPESHRRLRVVLFWQDPEIDEWLAGHALGARLHPKLRRHLLWLLWRRNRSLAVTALTAAAQAGETDLILTFLQWVARDPRWGDREFLCEAFRADFPEQHRCLALCGLDRLGGEDSSRWQAQIEALSQDSECHPRLRLRTLGVRLRQGDSEARQELTLHATSDPNLLQRAEAVGILGEIEPAESLPLLRQALEQERHHPMQTSAPAAEEAALWLARLGTSEARTTLLRAYLRAETFSLRHALEDYVSALADTPEGAKPRVDYPELNWRRTHQTWEEA